MRERLHIQKKVPTQSTYTPVTNPFQTRSFGIQKASDYKSSAQQNVDFNAQYEHAKRFALNLSHIPVNAPGTAPPAPIQTKLTIGQPGDKYEQEADNVASQVVQQINAPAVEQSNQGQTVQRDELPKEEEEAPVQTKLVSDSIQRDELPKEEEEAPVQAKLVSDSIQRDELPKEEEEAPVQAKLVSDSIQRDELPKEEEMQNQPLVQPKSVEGGTPAAPNVESSIQGAKGSGQPLDNNVRQSMEQAFGTDFSNVKIHTDGQSDVLNRSLQSRAFTTGQDVFFRSGEYNPGSRGGQELLAHELTHVVQQTGTVQRQVKAGISRT